MSGLSLPNIVSGYAHMEMGGQKASRSVIPYDSFIIKKPKMYNHVAVNAHVINTMFGTPSVPRTEDPEVT